MGKLGDLERFLNHEAAATNRRVKTVMKIDRRIVDYRIDQSEEDKKAVEAIARRLAANAANPSNLVQRENEPTVMLHLQTGRRGCRPSKIHLRTGLSTLNLPVGSGGIGALI